MFFSFHDTRSPPPPTNPHHIYQHPAHQLMIQSISTNHPITTSHLNPSPLLVATSSLICLPALSLILHTPSPDARKYTKDICIMFLMSAASVCRWANPTPFNCALDRTLAKIFFIYFVTTSALVHPNLSHSIFHSVLCVSFFAASRYFRKIRPHPIWRWCHSTFHILCVFFASRDVYRVPFFP